MNSKVIWLSSCAFLVYLIILIGGYTRLSHSGLSIVEWKPITGIMPPLDEISWQSEFNLYKQSPEYQKINFNMSLNEFKKIFFVEYFHRIIGRLIGILFILPFFYFIYKKQLTKEESKYYFIIALLIGLQGLVGWLMVKSGLINDPYVSQYRLATHLIIACLIFTLLIWKIVPGKSRSSIYGYFSYSLLLLQIFSGGLVAGLHAGLIYNSFPLMDGEILPSGAFSQLPIWRNFFENVTLVQFTHRMLGFINFINLIAYSFKLSKLEKLNKKAALIVCLVTLQLLLGIFTLLYSVPMSLALLHQAFAVILLMSVIISLKSNGNLYHVH